MNNNVYINSFEGAEIWESINRDKKLKDNFCGMLPYSSQLSKLLNLGLKTFVCKTNKDIVQSYDVINVKFKQKVHNGEFIIKKLKEKISRVDRLIEKYKNELKKTTKIVDKEKLEEKINKSKQYREKLKTYTKVICEEITLDKWKEIKADDTVDENTKQKIKGLRTLLYTKGFTLTFGKKSIEYVVMSRSSAKSRAGKVLFVKKQLKDKIIKYMRLGMNLEGRQDIDFPSLLSYESLIGSSAEDTIKIDTKNIFIVQDVKSVFTINCNVVKKDDDKKKKDDDRYLISKPVDNYKMENDIFDGEGIIDVSLLKSIERENYGMCLLRQHMFKCCVFNTNIQDFLKDYANNHHIDFDIWQLTDIFNNKIYAKDILLVTTPNSLKFLKFSKVKGSRPKMFECWKQKVEADDDIFYICKSEHKSKRGYDDNGQILQQTSYQMLNTMPISKDDMPKLSEYELNYIDKLKNDIYTYIEYLKYTKNIMNSNEMLVDLYNKNNNLMHTKVFRDKRKKDIQKYVKHVKKGKLRLVGDYCTIFQNGKELLYNIVGELPVNKNNEGDYILDYDKWEYEAILKKNECYTTLHPFENEYVAFRNPNTSPSNCLILKNKDSEFIEKYFNFADNIIYTNAIDFPINRILSGQDVDSDSLVLFNNNCLLRNAKNCFGNDKYRVCENGVDKDKRPYTVNTTDMAKIDNILAESQKNIGEVVNTAMLYMSEYWNLRNKGCKDYEKLNKLMQGVDIGTILSEICIDSAKRMYDINIKKEIKHLQSNSILPTNKPLFFKYISKNNNISKKIEHYDTAMDYLQDILNKIEDAQYDTDRKLETLLKDMDISKVKTKQEEGILNIIEDTIKVTKSLRSKITDNMQDDEKEEIYTLMQRKQKIGIQRIKHYKLKNELFNRIIFEVFTNKIKFKYKLELLNALYCLNKDMFLNSFKGHLEK